MLFPPDEPLGDLFDKPTYLPPYDSPIEDIFAYHVVKYLAADAKMQPQHPIKTAAGDFILDFMLEGGGSSIGVECDGKAYHNAYRDDWRDALILGTGRVVAIYRFSGRILSYHIDDCLTLMARWDSHLFSHRGLLNLETLTSEEVRTADFQAEDSVAFIRYEDRPNERVFDEMVSRRSLDRVGYRWRSYIARAAQYPGRALDEIIALEKSK